MTNGEDPNEGLVIGETTRAVRGHPKGSDCWVMVGQLPGGHVLVLFDGDTRLHCLHHRYLRLWEFENVDDATPDSR